MGSIVQLLLIVFIKDRINYIGKIIYYIFPLFAFVISIGIWTLIWSKYDGMWSNIQKEIITVFAGLIGAIGVFVTVAVNYENHEQNRNIQSEIERKRRKTEQKIENARRDNETIKDLNERLHEILKNRHSTDENVRASSYFQLAGLYKDWGLLGENSAIIEAQRKVQQKNILKLIFGTAPDENAETKKCAQKNSAQVQSSFLPKKVKEHVKRSFLEIRTLNSVIADIFPNIYDKDKESFEPFDLQYAELSGLTFSEVFFPQRSNLSHADLTGAHLRSTDLQRANLQDANLQDANLQEANLQRAKLQEANLQRAKLQEANLQRAKLQRAKLQEANLQNAKLENAKLEDANLQRAKLQGAKLQEANLQEANLWHANLWHANLQGAKLQGAKLQGANLQEANLQEANLWHANLQDANLEFAHLRGVNLRYANLRYANLQDAYLYDVKELTAEQLAQARNIESIQTRNWQFGPPDHSKEDQDLKNLIQEALKIQEEQKNNPPQNS
ncbi:pentapeptide repeat-containing protein [Rothia sp. CCM 9419]|uniref:pentapeptide repeat-containing protein n=1 Tax=Rothia sp. CCM 9419 TaxID=3402662 RepID=UPI003AEE9068